MKSIFAEAVEQDFLLKDPTRGIKIPRNLREKDKTTLTWHQLRAVLASVTTRDRMLLTLEMTVKDIQSSHPALLGRHHSQRVYAGVAGKCWADGRIDVRGVNGP
jgi:hypothetical protein